MGFFICGLWSCLASALTVRAIKNITMDDYDPRIIYSNSPDWRHETVLYPPPLSIGFIILKQMLTY